jgi:hypothetical protein
MARDFPIDTVPVAILPLLIEARHELHRFGAPQACRLSDKISAALEALIECAEDVESYGNKWTGGTMGNLAQSLNVATKPWRV